MREVRLRLNILVYSRLQMVGNGVTFWHIICTAFGYWDDSTKPQEKIFSILN